MSWDHSTGADHYTVRIYTEGNYGKTVYPDSLRMTGLAQLMEQTLSRKRASFQRTTTSTHKRGYHRASEKYVCWSRMQAEAGESLEEIVARKECERLAGGGLFLWGVGNAPPVGIKALARMGRQIPVIFSIMKTKARPIDTTPMRTVIWRRYLDSNGFEWPLPEHALVTSRGDSENGAKRAHYALMCWSGTPLQLERGTQFDHHAYRNASKRGAPVGGSQVTALLEPITEPSDQAEYEINLRAFLSESYWARLTDALELSNEKLAALDQYTDMSVDKWVAFVSYLRHSKTDLADRYDQQLRLL